MKTVKINFYGFYSGFDINDNFLLDALKKHVNYEISDEPEYIFYSVFDNEYLLHSDAVRIFFTGENIAPNFQLCDYAIGFERLDFGDRYLRFPFYYGLKEYRNDLLLAQTKHLRKKDYIDSKRFCSFVYSNSDTDGMRKKLFDNLNAYQTVDSGGSYLNNISKKIEDKIAFESQHKFSIACENSSHIGYCTEKIIQSFAAGTVPIYFGDPTIAMDFNEKSFVNCHKFEDVSEVVHYIQYLNTNDNAYLEFLHQPIFKSDTIIEDMEGKLDSFISNIFTQRRENAYRRNRFFWGKKIDQKYEKMYKLEKVYKKIMRK